MQNKRKNTRSKAKPAQATPRKSKGLGGGGSILRANSRAERLERARAELRRRRANKAAGRARARAIARGTASRPGRDDLRRADWGVLPSATVAAEAITRRRGDITGDGAAGRKDKRARSCGVGVDPADERARARADAPLSWADVVMRIGRAAAHKQARRLRESTGREASATSIDDAAADAVAAVFEAITFLPGVRAGHFERGGPAEDRALSAGVGLFAMRGAWRSLRTWATLGVTGDANHAPHVTRSATWADYVEAQAGDILHPAELPEGTQARARWRAARWVFRAGMAGPWPVQPAAAARAHKSARRVCRVVAGLILGHGDKAALCSAVGLTEDGFTRAVRRLQFWARLRRVRVAMLRASEDYRRARAEMRAHALDAASAHKRLAAALPSAARPVRRAGALARRWRANGPATWARSRAARLMDWRGDSVAAAIWWRERARAMERAQMRAFDGLLGVVREADGFEPVALPSVRPRAVGARRSDVPPVGPSGESALAALYQRAEATRQAAHALRAV